MLNPFRNAKRDVSHALEHFFGATSRDVDPRVPFEETRAEMPLKKILDDWDDYAGWGEFDPGELSGAPPDEVRAELGSYRGSTWSHRAMTWLKDGVPAVVLVEGKDENGKTMRLLGDGRGRANFAVALGIKTLPVIVLREKVA